MNRLPRSCLHHSVDPNNGHRKSRFDRIRLATVGMFGVLSAVIVSWTLVSSLRRGPGSLLGFGRRGVEIDASVARIVGGIAVMDNDRFPYMASILNSRREQSGGLNVWHVCGGSLVAPDVVLGAAHCSGANADFIQLGKRHVIGSKNGDRNDDVETFRILEQVVHPEYDRESFYHDLVLYRLSSRSNKRPVLLEHTTDDADVEREMEAQDKFSILGWGKKKWQGSKSLYLREAEVYYIPHERCVSEQYKHGPLIRRDAMMCLAADGRDSCQGDSGGPLVRKQRNARRRNDPEHDAQVGVTSWGVGCANPSYPGIYAKIDLDWIHHVVCDPVDGLSPRSCVDGALDRDHSANALETATPVTESERLGTDTDVVVDNAAGPECRDRPGNEFFKEDWDTYLWNCPKVKHFWWYACLYYSGHCPETCCLESCDAATGRCGPQ